MSYVYMQTESQLWTVGFYTPDGTWMPESDHGTPGDAAKRVAWLNGGYSRNPSLEEALNSGDGSYRP